MRLISLDEAAPSAHAPLSHLQGLRSGSRCSCAGPALAICFAQVLAMFRACRSLSLQKPTTRPALPPARPWIHNDTECFARIDVSHNQSPVLKWSTQNHASRIKKADIRSYLWLGLSLTNLHLPGVSIVAHVRSPAVVVAGLGGVSGVLACTAAGGSKRTAGYQCLKSTRPLPVSYM